MTSSSRRTTRGVACAAALVTLVACAGPAPVRVEVGELRGEARAVQVGELDAQDVAAAQWAFGLDLLHAVCDGAPGENLLLSPTSAAEALGLLYPAARGETAEDLGSLLRLPSWSPDVVAGVQEHTRALAGLSHDGDLDADDAPDSLSLSNRIWTAPGVKPEQEYLDDVATAFESALETVDFAGDPVGSTDRINEAVSEDTHGIIEKLFDSPLPTQTVVVLTNALHLKARWLQPFSFSDDAPFRAPGGETSADMMSGAWGTGRSADGWQAVELPYRDGTLAAVAILPPSDEDPCGIDAETLGALDGATGTEVDVDLPRMHLEQTHQLADVLADLGLPLDGDYSGLGADGASVDQVVQKTFLEVDEVGTEAAAATGVAMVASAPPPRERVTFDRPFLFVLTDTATRSPLFLTVVQDPSA